MAEDGDDLLRRADALLSRHRGAAQPTAAEAPAPVPAPPPPAEDEIPPRTEVVPGELWPAPIGAPASGEVISRVQVQNLEHTVYQKLKRDLDDRIVQVVQERVMPEIGGALDNALARMSLDIKTDINQLVRASIEETLNTQIKNLRVAVEAKAAMREMTAAAPGAMPGAGDAGTGLAKSFEPAAIEGRWYAAWEKSGYFQAGLDEANPKRFCILLPPPNVTGTLHMGHAFQHTLMDALTRYHRMRGYNTLWQPGTDHAGIATQI